MQISINGNYSDKVVIDIEPGENDSMYVVVEFEGEGEVYEGEIPLMNNKNREKK